MVQKTFCSFLPLALAGLILLGCTGSPPDATSRRGADSTADSTAGRIVNCCIKPSCEVCVEKFGRCNCLEDLKAGRPICGQCIEGYEHGKGKL